MNLYMSNISTFGFAIYKFEWHYPNVWYICMWFFISASTILLDMWRFQTEEWEVVMCRTSRINGFSKNEVILFALVGKIPSCSAWYLVQVCMISFLGEWSFWIWQWKNCPCIVLAVFIDSITTYIARVHLLEYRDFYEGLMYSRKQYMYSFNV